MKIWMIVAASLVVLGLIVTMVAIALVDFDFKEFDMKKCELNTHTVTEEFSGISVKTNISKVMFLPSLDGQVRVECFERERENHVVSVENGTLVIEMVDTRSWYHHISFFSFSVPQITVYLPAGEYGDLCVMGDTGDVSLPKDFSFASVDVSLDTGDVECAASSTGLMKIKTSTGDVELENFSADALEIRTSTGDIEVSSLSCAGDVSVRVSTGEADFENVTCQNLTTVGTTGDFSLNNVIATGSMSIERDTGDVHLMRCDATEVVITTDTGDVTGSFRTDKIVWASTDTGRVDVPKTTEGGRCEITTDTGNIKISIVP